MSTAAYPDPPLTDGVIALRRWTMDDAPQVVRCCNDPEIRRWLPAIPAPYTTDDAVGFISGAGIGPGEEWVRLAIAEPGSPMALGSIGVRTISAETAQTGYWVAPEARGRGLASRALVLVSRWALRTFPIARLQLFTDVENPASMRVAERAGFRREGTLRNWYDLRGERRDAVMFALLPEDLA
jgi:RimJ/RimL family protein N-acetyltransferase